jgi:predicted lipid-binding transport protein (Tim44 family)
MSDGYQYFDIIIFAMVAAFLILRLRSVLGRRTGTEKPPNSAFLERFGIKRDTPPTDNNIVPLPPRETPAAELVPPPPGAGEPSGLDQIRNVDRSFDPSHFLQGARGAFEMIVHAFAAGDTATLRPLVSDEVYDHFAEAIRHRVDNKETVESNLVAIKSAEIDEAELNGRTAFVTVKFHSEQVNVIRGADGKIIEGEPDHVVEKTDFWTFARNTRSQDPNWLLVATRSA